jgi:hypothetical protein
VLERQGGGLIYGMIMKSDLACINHIPVSLFTCRYVEKHTALSFILSE